MKNIAIYPGTFDPITNGHIDVIKKALKLADKIIVGISDGNEKNFLFPIDERLNIVKKALYADLKLPKNKIQVIKFNSLTTELCVKYKSNLILRGLRAVSDFEYEFQLAGMNRKLNNKVETIFLMSDVENQIISSRFVKEIAQHNGDLRKFTTNLISFDAWLIFQVVFKSEFFASSGFLDDLIILMTLSIFSTLTDNPSNI